MNSSADGNRNTVWLCSSVAVLILGQLVASNALRDGFFLTHFDATALPPIILVSSVASALVIFGCTRIFQRIPPVQAIPYFLLLSAILHLSTWALSFQTPRLAAVLLFVHTMTLGGVVVSGFWSVVNERFDPHTAKRFVGRIGGGASLGGVLGGLGASLGAQYVEVPTMFLFLGFTCLISAAGLRRIGPGDHAEPARKEASGSALRIMRQSRYLRNLALLVALGAFTQATYDFVFKVRAVDHFTSSADLVSFFALFYTVVAVGTFFLQNLLARASLRYLGLSLTVATLPGVGAVFGIASLVFPGLVTAALVRGGIGAVENSLFRSGYELHYTPVLTEKKRATKTFIDVGVNKAGTALGSGVTLLVLWATTSSALSVLVVCGFVASIAALVVTRKLHQGYVAALAEQLRVGLIKPDQLVTLDATSKIAAEQVRAEMDLHPAAKTGGFDD